VQYLEIQEIITGYAILHTSFAIITLRGSSPTVHGPVDETLSPFTIVQFEREKTQKNDFEVHALLST
jgi:hypothetical protein